MEKESLYLCMGSACHQLGVYHVLPAIQLLIKTYGLDDYVELKGAFCLGACTRGINMQFGGQLFHDIKPENIEEKFQNEILPAIEKGLGRIS